MRTLLYDMSGMVSSLLFVNFVMDFDSTPWWGNVLRMRVVMARTLSLDGHERPRGGYMWFRNISHDRSPYRRPYARPSSPECSVCRNRQCDTTFAIRPLHSPPWTPNMYWPSWAFTSWRRSQPQSPSRLGALGSPRLKQMRAAVIAVWHSKMSLNSSDINHLQCHTPSSWGQPCRADVPADTHDGDCFHTVLSLCEVHEYFVT